MIHDITEDIYNTMKRDIDSYVKRGDLKKEDVEMFLNDIPQFTIKINDYSNVKSDFIRKMLRNRSENKAKKQMDRIILPFAIKLIDYCASPEVHMQNEVMKFIMR